MYSSEDIASVAALAKRRAKSEASGLVLVGFEESQALLQGQTAAATID